MISCWHFTPIILVVGGETNIGTKLQTMLKMISRASSDFSNVLTSALLCPPVVFLAKSAAGPDHHPQNSAPNLKGEKGYLNIRKLCVVEVLHILKSKYFVNISAIQLSFSVCVCVCYLTGLLLSETRSDSKQLSSCESR